MEAEVVRIAASQGLWAVLFVALLFYVLKENAKREERLLQCLDKLGEQYECLARDVSEVKDDIKELKNKVR